MIDHFAPVEVRKATEGEEAEQGRRSSGVKVAGRKVTKKKTVMPK